MRRVVPARSYTAAEYRRAAARVRALKDGEHHSRLNPERLAEALERAACRPADPRNVELLDSLPLVVYVAVV